MDLEVEGRHALLFDDDATAGFVNSREALVPWSADSALLIDRYDARHLLDRVPQRPAAASRRRHDTDLEPEIDLERYLDLPPPDATDKEDSASEMKKGPEVANSGAYQAVPFCYGNADVSVDSNPDIGTNYTGYYPPFPVPENLLSYLPPTEKLHQIIARTAIFVSEHGGQSEIVLRVKQGNNPTFGFLMPDHHLHPYFQFLVDHPQLLKSDMNSKVQLGKNLDGQENEAHVVEGGALSLLGSVYGSVEDDDSVFQVQSDSNKLEPHNAVDVDVRAEKGESSMTMPLDKKIIMKHPVTVTAKEKNFATRRHRSVNSASASAASSKKAGDNMPQTSQPGISDGKPFILEPPSFLKRIMDKIVELIIKNGKDFEAVLIEQDKTAARFPFLLPSNQYHSYYLKILKEAREGHPGSKLRVEEAPNKESALNDEILAEQSEGWFYDPHRKEKFKMVIGAPKKDPHDPHSKPAKRSGVSADEAAAIVLAATRGVSPANARSLGETKLASSIGSLSALQCHNRIPKPTSNDEAGDSGSIGKGARDGSGKIDDVLIAKAIAKTTALAASSEADSSEAGLTKEQKLKAERLKRAKLFAAMIKSGGQHVNKFVHATSTHTGSSKAASGGPSNPVSEPNVMNKDREGSSVPVEAVISDIAKSRERDSVHNHHLERKYRKRHHLGSRGDEEESEEDHKHTRKKHYSEYSSCYEVSEDRNHSKKKHHSEYSSRYEEESGEDHKNSRKKRLSEHSSHYEEESGEDHKHSRKKHHSEHSSCYDGDNHKHQKSHSSKDKESRHHHKIDSPSEDEHRHRKSSRSRHRHKSHCHSNDEDRGRKRSDKHRRNLHSEKKHEIDFADDAVILNRLDEVSLILSDPDGQAGASAVADAQPSDATEVPDELRAKVRAMLLETM